MASSFSVSTLTAYVDQSNTDLIRKPLLQNTTSKLFQIAAGIKNTGQLPLLSTTPNYQDGATCGFTASGSANFTARTIAVGKFKSDLELCLKDIEPYYTSQMLAKGSHQEGFSAEQTVVDQFIANVSKDVEVALWQGSTVASASATDLKGKFDGFLRTIENSSGSSGYINATGSYFSGLGSGSNDIISGSITSANVRQLIEQNVYSRIPVEIIDSPTAGIFIGRDVARLYSQAVNTGSGNYNVYLKDGDQMYVVGTNFPIYVVNGLNNTSKVVALDKTNAWIGVDLASDTDSLRSWFSQDNNSVRLELDAKMGTQIAWPDQVVYAFIH